MKRLPDEPHCLTGPDAGLLEDAANWVIRLRYESPDAQTRNEFDLWLTRSADHARAWARAQSVLGTFDQLPSRIGKQALQSTLANPLRRTVLRAALVAVVVAPVTVMGTRPTLWRTWTADARTATGERRAMVLADGSRLVLNTASAIDVVYTATERRIVMHAGEILVNTADEARTYRPFIVQTRHGHIQALGTRFVVREFDAQTTVSVLEHAVRLHPRQAQPVRLNAGETVAFNTGDVGQPGIASPSAGLWEQGMFVANNMRLEDLLAELGRYRPGMLSCAAQVGDLRVTAAVSLDDTDAALTMLAQTLNLKIQRISRYWVMLKAA